MPDLVIACPKCGEPCAFPDIKKLALALLEPKPAWPGNPVFVTPEEKAVLYGRAEESDHA